MIVGVSTWVSPSLDNVVSEVNSTQNFIVTEILPYIILHALDVWILRFFERAKYGYEEKNLDLLHLE
jgi:hypothetical protein